MDYFNESRTYLIIAFLILLFSILLFSHWKNKCSRELFSNPYMIYYLDGYIDPNDSKRLTINETPLKTGVVHKNSCNSLCLSQKECLEGNTECKSTYKPNKNCYCQFKRVNNVESFTGIGKNIVEFPKADPWTYAVSDTTNTQIKNVNTPLNELKLVEPYEKLSVSFWLYLETNPPQYIPIVEIVDENKNNILSLYIYINPGNEKIILVRYKTGNNYDVYNTSKESVFHLVVTYYGPSESNTVSGYHIYRNGELITKEQQSIQLETLSTPELKSGLTLNRIGGDNVRIKNLNLHRAALNITDIQLLYKPICEFESMKYGTFYPDLVNAFGYNTNAFKQHYITYGIHEGRTPCGKFNPTCKFDAKTYAELNPDLPEDIKNDVNKLTQHYKYKGINEGRKVCYTDKK